MKFVEDVSLWEDGEDAIEFGNYENEVDWRCCWIG